MVSAPRHRSYYLNIMQTAQNTKCTEKGEGKANLILVQSTKIFGAEIEEGSLEGSVGGGGVNQGARQIKVGQ